MSTYFDAHQEGSGILKWQHYFDIYHRHFSKFVGREINVLEIGIYSGGSLEMWREYFGPRARIYGADIEPSCMEYEDRAERIFIGDQADGRFWQEVLCAAPNFDVVIDDGGHLASQQIATLEALLGHMSPGGVYVCEDVHGRTNGFQSYVSGLARNLNAWGSTSGHASRRIPTGFQQRVDSVHLYPFVTVIELRATPLSELSSERRGTQWLPVYGSPGP